MKIHSVTARFHPIIGGVETRILALSKRFVEHGHTVTVHTTTIGPQGKVLPKNDEVHGIKIVRYKPKFNLGYFISYWKPIIENADIIDLQGYPSLYNDFTVKKYKGKLPIVHTPHGVSLPPKTKTQAFMRKLYDRFYGFKSLRAAEIIITMTQDEQNWCRSHKLMLGNFKSILSGVEDEIFEEVNPQIIKSKYAIDNYILFMGRIHKEKAPVHLVQAFSLLKDEIQDVKLVFAGPDGGEVKNLKAEIRRLNLDDKVVLTGMVSEEEKRALLSGCRFFVNPSLFEAQGVVFFEAWAQKKSVIGTRVGGVPYIIKDGETGLLYNYGDVNALAKHIKFLLENNDKAQTMGQKGYEFVYGNYRWDDVAKRMEQVFSETLNNFKSRA